MKHKLTILTGAGLLALTSLAGAQQATTDPVGYITINVAAKASGAAITPIAPTLVNKVEFSGTISAINATTITLNGAAFTANQFQASTYPDSSPLYSYYVEVTSGTGEGAWTNISGNTANSITVVDDMTPFASVGATVKIRKHVTVAEVLGANNSAGLQGGEDAGTADEVFFVDASTKKTRSVFFESVSKVWSDADYNDAGNFPIEPQQGLLVKRKANTPVSFVRVGHVKTGKTLLAIYAGQNVVAVPRAVGVTLGASNLPLTPGDDAGVADEVFVYNNGEATSYFNDGTGLFDAEYQPGENVLLKEGTAVVIKRKVNTDTNWSVPAETIAP